MTHSGILLKVIRERFGEHLQLYMRPPVSIALQLSGQMVIRQLLSQAAL